MLKEDILFELKKNVQEDKFLKIVFSDRQNGEFNKIIMKPISLKTCKNIQIESFKDNKAFPEPLTTKVARFLSTI